MHKQKQWKIDENMSKIDIMRSTRAYANSLNTIPKTKQVIMLYEGVIKHLNKAIIAIEENDIELRYNSIDKASKIIMGLHSALDFENAKSVSDVLDRYYTYIYFRIITIHSTNNIDDIKTIIEEIDNMQNTWSEVFASQD
jgi:flagellar secretion chaperone FliS